MFFRRKKKIPIEEKLIQEAKPLLERIMQYVDNDTKNVDKIYAFCSNEDGALAFQAFFVINGCYLEIHTINKCSDKQYDVSDDAQLSLLDDGSNYCERLFNLFKEYKQEIPTQIIIEYDIKNEKFNTKIDYELHWSNDEEKLPEDIMDEWFENLKKNNESLDTDIFQTIRRSNYPTYLEEIKSLNNINVLNDFQQNLLQEAIANKRNDIAKDLIKRGIDVNNQDYKGVTPLHYAIQYNLYDIVKLLLDNGAEVNIKDYYGNNSLWRAVFEENEPIVKLLLDYGADKYNENNAQATPCSFAQKIENNKLLEILGC